MNRARHWRENEAYVSQQPQRKIVVKVKQKSWVTKGEKVIYSLFCIGLIVVSMYLVSYASKLDQVNRDVQQLQQEVHNQKIENESLYFEVSELSSPERIITIAHENGLKIQDAKVKRATAANQ